MWTRRQFLAAGGGAMASLALASDKPLAPRPPMFPAKAKSVIFLFMNGGVSQVDSFDPKPELVRHHGKKMTTDIVRNLGPVKTFFGGDNAPLMKSPFTFKKYGACGLEVSELFQNVATCADDLAVIRSITCDNNNHAPACFQMNTGSLFQGYPSIGAWATYGLGTENQDLPGYVVMSERNSLPIGGPSNWGCGFLPAAYQGTLLRATGTPILDLHPSEPISRQAQRDSLDLIQKLNREHLKTRPGDTELEARIESYELAYRMQAKAPEVVDVSKEPPETLALYGIDNKKTEEIGRMCLLARRLVERGVRFVQIYCGSYSNGGDAWDAHGNIGKNHRERAGECDRPIAALLKDLKRTGLLSQTLVVWAGDFGRMPISQGSDGRDHNPGVQTAWLAGAGVKGGSVTGASDEVGYKAAEEPHHVRDLHATILHLLGLDDMKLTFLFNGRFQRLTENGGDVIKNALS